MALIEKDLTTELWREYDFGGRTYRIDEPGKLYYREDGSTHRITKYDPSIDAVVVHSVPAPGHLGCVLRWVSKDSTVPVNF